MKRTLLRTAAIAVAIAGMSATASYAAQAPDEITIISPEQIISVDPCNLAHSHVGRTMKENVVETLTALDPVAGGVKPKLASSWDKIDDTTWRFHLRDGVKFQDGTPFNADAVVAAITRLMNKDVECIDRTKFFGNVTLTTKVVDPVTIDVMTSIPQPILPTQFTAVGIASPKTNPTGPEKAPIGTGPYQLASWEQGQDTLVLTRFDGYWGDKPDVAKVTFVYRQESAVAAAMVATGEADLAPDIAQQDANNPNTDVAYANTNTVQLIMPVDLPPFNDIRVRKAINLAIDRQSFIGGIMSDKVQVAARMVLPFINGYDPNMKPWPFDPDQAKSLLAAAKADGVPVDAAFTLYASPGGITNKADLMEAVSNMWNDVGFNSKSQIIDKAQIVELMNRPHPATRPLGIVLANHDNNTGDAFNTLYLKYDSKGAQSVAEDAELDKLIEDGGKASGTDRDDLFRKAFARIHDDLVPDAVLFHLVSYARVGPRISYTPNALTFAEIHVAEIKLKK